MVLLVRVEKSDDDVKTKEELVFVQCAECTEPIHEIGRLLKCVCFRWCKLDEVDRSTLEKREV